MEYEGLNAAGYDPLPDEPRDMADPSTGKDKYIRLWAGVGYSI